MLYERTGLTRYNPKKATPGYTLFSPINTTGTFIIDMEGNVVHQWKQPGRPGAYAYLLPTGNLLGSIRTPEEELHLPAKGGHLREQDWKGKVLWEHVDHFQHHDFRRCANGNTVYIGWELLSKRNQKRVRGGIPGSEHKNGIYGDFIREITPEGKTVWEWRTSRDLELEKYPICALCDRREMAHANTVFPLPNGDFMVSWRNNHLLATIDRKTKKFKWVMHDPYLGHQHDVQRLANGNVLVFANGYHAPWEGAQIGAHVFEIDPRRKNKIVWEYRGQPGFTFDSQTISGAQRLWSGNTLICEGRWGRIFEVTPKGEIVWNYVSPYFVTDKKSPLFGANGVFRAYRYRDDSPEIGGRLPRLTKSRRRAKPATKSSAKPKAKTKPKPKAKPKSKAARRRRA